jgi:tRNA dimethylallyltransferase
MKPEAIILSGVTASGKTEIAIDFCLRFLDKYTQKIEIINADSILIYKGLDIGSAKPSKDEQSRIPHHLLDLCEPNHRFSSGDYLRAFQKVWEKLKSEGKKALIVGGTGFYLKGLIYGIWDAPPSDPKLRTQLEAHDNETLYSELKKLDPQSALQIHPNDRYRIVRSLEICILSGKKRSEIKINQNTIADPRFELAVLDRPDDEIERRIQKRTETMIQNGLINEVQFLRKIYPNARPLDSVGYKETWNYLNQIPPKGRKVSPGIEGLKEEINLATKQLVKKQRTWFQGEAQSRFYTLDQDLKKLYNRLWEVYSE